jgi:hypothetical protein
MDIKADTISAKMDTNGHEWTPKVDTGYIRSFNGHENSVHSCPITLQQGSRSAKGFARWLPEPKWQVNQIKAAGMGSESVLWFLLFVV